MELPKVKNYVVKSDGYGKLFECTNTLRLCTIYHLKVTAQLISELYQLSRILSAF